MNVIRINLNYFFLIKKNFFILRTLVFLLIFFNLKIINNYILFKVIINFFKFLNYFFIIKFLFFFKNYIYLYNNIFNFLIFKNYLNLNFINRSKFKNNNLLVKTVKYKIIDIKKISKTSKNGKFKKFIVILVIGNYSGWFGIGIGKDLYLNEAFYKAYLKSFKNIYYLDIKKLEKCNKYNLIKYRKNKFLIKNIIKNYNIFAWNTLKFIFELWGFNNISLKLLGSKNKLNLIKTFIKKLWLQ
uniref:30S ribosomal protein S5 n=1 Tax=Nephromyces sp. ex Molgula occidentalis TaxID=2544991 RepID=A0A5C1H7T1_9APIC|nr:30S ribosomal protein S5 [Nephromyces sp. ex Molgula occidentalis]